MGCRRHTGAVTVEQAVEKYISNRRWLQGADAASRDHMMFTRTLHGESLAGVQLAELDATHIEDWRNGLIKRGRSRWSRAIRKTVAGINAQRREVDPKARDFPADVCCYDMRHTAISDWLINGVDIGTVAKLAGTSVLMIDRHYHKFIRSAVAEQLAKIVVV